MGCGPHETYKNMEKITEDGGILKLIIKSSESPVQDPVWERASNARFHYSTYTFAEKTECCDHSHHHHDHKEHSHSHVQKGEKLEKRLIATTRDIEPFELRIGMGFNVEMFENCIKSMSIGESARFLIFPPNFKVPDPFC